MSMLHLCFLRFIVSLLSVTRQKQRITTIILEPVRLQQGVKCPYKQYLYTHTLAAAGIYWPITPHPSLCRLDYQHRRISGQSPKG